MQLGEEVGEGGCAGPEKQINEKNQAGLRGAKSLPFQMEKSLLKVGRWAGLTSLTANSTRSQTFHSAQTRERWQALALHLWSRQQGGDWLGTRLRVGLVLSSTALTVKADPQEISTHST